MIILADAEATRAAGLALAKWFQARLQAAIDSAGSQLHLSGPLGAGKTTLVQGLLAGFGHRGAVRSPSYALLESYQFDGFEVHHFDLYRLSDPEELEFIGAREYFSQSALCIFEWPERASNWLPSPTLAIALDYHSCTEQRASGASDDFQRSLEISSIALDRATLDALEASLS